MYYFPMPAPNAMKLFHESYTNDLAYIHGITTQLLLTIGLGFVFTVLIIWIDRYDQLNIRNAELKLQEQKQEPIVQPEEPIVQPVEGVYVSKKGNIMSEKQYKNHIRQKNFDIAFHSRILAVHSMKQLLDICANILNSPEKKLDLSLEQIQKVRNDYKYAKTKINKYIKKSRNHPDVHILHALS